MNVDRVGAVMEVPHCTIRAEEMPSVELEPAPDARGELCRVRVLANRLQCTEVISSVEVVDPRLCRGRPIGPRAIRVLLGGRVASDPQRGNEQLLLTGMLVDTTQESGTEEIGVVRSTAHCSEGIAETRDRLPVRPVELLHDVLRRAGRDA